jgi:MFS family permease
MTVTRSPRALVPVLVFVGTVVAVISSLGAPLVPAIAETMGTSLPNAQWSLTVTLLVGAVATPVVGRLGDGPHRRTVVLVVLAVVTAGGVLAALPLGLAWLVAGRALQGVGLGLTPLAIATAREALTGQRSRSTIAALSITVVAGVGLGYPLAGLVAELGGVHAAFWAGAAVSAAALAASAAVLPP